jgi:hypothetical protein
MSLAPRRFRAVGSSGCDRGFSRNVPSSAQLRSRGALEAFGVARGAFDEIGARSWAVRVSAELRSIAAESAARRREP